MTRIVDRDAMTLQRLAATECAICGRTFPLSVHHIYPRSQGGDDVAANFIDVCGSGTTGCHGDIEHKVTETCEALRLHILLYREDTIEYLDAKLGGLDRALAWMDRSLRVSH